MRLTLPNLLQVDERFAKVENDLCAREKDVAERQVHMDTESAELARMQNNLDEATARAESELREQKIQVIQSQRELEAAHKLHSSLRSVFDTQKQHAELDATATDELKRFEMDADVVVQASALLKQQLGESEAKIEEIRSSLEVIDARIPTLEGEKKRAVSSRNFKAAKSIVAEIKTLTESKVGLEQQLEEARSEMNSLSDSIASRDSEEEEKRKVLKQKKIVVRREELARARVVRKMLMSCKRRLERSRSSKDDDSEIVLVAKPGIALVEEWGMALQNDINRLKSDLGEPVEDGAATEEEFSEDEEEAVDNEMEREGVDENISDMTVEESDLKDHHGVASAEKDISSTNDAMISHVESNAGASAEGSSKDVNDAAETEEKTVGEAGPEPDADVEAEADADEYTGADAGAEAKAAAEADAGAEAKAAAEAESEAKAAAEAESEAKAAAEAEAEAKAAAEAEAEAKAAAEAEAEAKAAAEAEAEAKAAAEAEAAEKKQLRIAELEAFIQDKEAAVEAAVEKDDFDLAQDEENLKQDALKELAALKA